MAMVEKEYSIYNEGEIRTIGVGYRKVKVKESKKFAYVSCGVYKVKLKLNIWENLRDNVYKINENGIGVLCPNYKNN